MELMTEHTDRHKIDAHSGDVALARAQAAAEAAQRALEPIAAEQQQFFRKADQRDADAAEAEGRRDGLLLKAARGDAQASALLEQLEPFVAANRREARDLRDAAKLLQPELDEKTRASQEAARHVQRLRHQSVIAERDRIAIELRAVVAAVFPVADRYVAAAEALAQSHLATFGERLLSETDPAFRVTRLIKVALQRHLGAASYHALNCSFDPAREPEL